MKSRWIKLCSILLVLTMLINMLPVHALALDSEDRGSASVQGDTESHTVQIIGEVEGLREEGIKHFRLSDGSFVAVSSGSTLITDCLWRRALTERPTPTHRQRSRQRWQMGSCSLSNTAASPFPCPCWIPLWRIR